MREHQMNFTERAMAMRGSMRDNFLRVARSGAVPPTILEQMREMVRADIAQRIGPGHGRPRGLAVALGDVMRHEVGFQRVERRGR